MRSKFYLLFPIHANECRKFFLLAALCFLVCTNYTLLRTVKETLVITKPEMGLEIVPFLRTWLLMPFMLLFVKMYASMSARWTQSRVCYTLISFFFVFFSLFVFVLYPYQSFFELTTMGSLIEKCPIPFAKQIAAMVRYWSFSTYYCLSEIWGTIVVLILFWGASNRHNTVDEAKRYYSPILFITNFSGLFASQICLQLSFGSLKHLLFPHADKWGATLLSITIVVCSLTAVILFLFYLLFTNFTASRSHNTEKPLLNKEMSLIEMIKSMRNNKNITTLAVMVFAYFFTSGIMEIVWKFYLQKLYPNPNDFNDYLSICTQYISVVSTFLAFGVTGDLIRRFPWRVSAAIMPIVLLFPTIGFLVISCFYDANPYLLTILGAFYYCINRICKFTFFDLSKEVATVELSYEEQIKSKAVLDGLLPKFGKTCESGFLQILLVAAGGFQLFMYPLMFFMLAVHLAWLYFMKEKNPKILTQTLSTTG